MLLSHSGPASALARSVFLACAVAGAAGAQAADPFAPGVRWSTAGTGGDAWMPQSALFAAGGELVWHAAGGAQPRVELLDASTMGPAASVRFSRALPGTTGVLAVAAGPGADSLYVAAQYPGPTAASRWTEVSRYDLHAAHPEAPLWARTLPMPGNGVARVAASRLGGEALAAVYDQAAQRLEVHWMRASDGLTTQSHVVSAPTLRQLVASHDLECVAFVVGAQARIVSRDGAVEHVEALGGATNALALSGDGLALAVGAAGRVRLLARGTSTWTLAREFTAGPSDVATRVALSDDGRTLALGWWDSVDTRTVRFELWRTDETTPRWSRVLTAPPGALQNFPEAVAVTADGSRAAFGAWGTGDSSPEALLVDRDSGGELLALDLPGSVRSLALDPTGTRLVVGFKHAHANQVASTGAVALHDTGERDVQLLEPLSVGGAFHVATRRAGAPNAYFIVGPPAAFPTPLGAALGSLWVDRAQASVFARRCDGSGRANLSLNAPGFLGSGPLAIQTYFRGAGVAAFSQHVVAPVIR